VKLAAADDAGLELAAGILLSGGVAVLPTDTVYGLAAHPDFPAAVKRLYSIKDRAAAKPIALLAADESAAARYIGDEAAAIGAKYWPGALTLVFGGEGVRVPAHGWLRRLIAKCGGVLRVTSANLSGRREATDAEAALAEVGLSADLTVDGGISPGGTASSVWKVEAGGIEVLREGPVKP
jgi:L-threonylcarbamoyladenylate synthase